MRKTSKNDKKRSAKRKRRKSGSGRTQDLGPDPNIGYREKVCKKCGGHTWTTDSIHHCGGELA